ERQRGAVFIGGFTLLQCIVEHPTVFERDIPKVTVTADAHVHAFRQCVERGDTDTMEATGDRIPAAAELTSGVQDRHNHFNGGFIFGGVHGHGNTATIVFNAHAAIFLEGHVDGVSVAGQGLIHRVIHDLIYKV